MDSELTDLAGAGIAIEVVYFSYATREHPAIELKVLTENGSPCPVLDAAGDINGVLLRAIPSGDVANDAHYDDWFGNRGNPDNCYPPSFDLDVTDLDVDLPATIRLYDESGEIRLVVTAPFTEASRPTCDLILDGGSASSCSAEVIDDPHTH